ncbi:MFS transporter [Variovorax sp. dw_954]|uniref:MFS transporter n=1 Tax=Variovorax sp. dw_954 TaxID=2720078 RepID=UPI001BD52DA2|nr:MFS transporter [Variovorax sp. dw_954]
MSSSATVGLATMPTPAEMGRAESLYSKVGWRLLPVLLVAYMVAYLDRINIGYAQLGMKQTLPFSNEVYGLGAGIFFIGYLIFEVPSNLMLVKIGARKTMLRIMVLWGLAATAMMFVTTPTEFYVVRFLLGAFEAGFFPGIILYFTYWYPSIRRGQVIAIFMSATTLMSVVAGPLSGATLKFLDGVNGWHGWQWLFLVQGMPAAILGVVLFFWLDDKPAQAKWLSPAEKNLLQFNLENDIDTSGKAGHSFGKSLRDPKVYLLSLAYFLLLGATYALVFWLPTLIQSWGVKDVLMVGIYAAIPNAVGVVGMIWLGRSSDRHGERRWHYFACVLIAAIGLGITTLLTGALVPSLAALSFAVIGVAAATPLFWTAVTEYLPRSSAAGGIAFISSLGAFGPSVSPSVNAAITKATGNGVYSMYAVMAAYIVSGALLLMVVRAKNNEGQIS